jgi:hypothetical protein
MTYVGYHAHARPAARLRPLSIPLPPLAWGRLAMVIGSLLAWVGVIAAARAIF